MNRTDIDPEYYRSGEDDEGRPQEAHGYWLLSENWDRHQREWLEVSEAISEGRACKWDKGMTAVPF